MKRILRFTAFLCIAMMHQPALNAMKRPRKGNSVPQIAPGPLNATLYNAAKNLQGQAAYNTIMEFVALGADPNACNAEGESALHAAANAGNFHGVKALVDANAEVNIWDQRRTTPLHAAIDTQHAKTKRTRWAIIKYLVANGADKWLTPEYSALKHAVIHRDELACSALLTTLSKNETGESLVTLVQKELNNLATELNKTDAQQRTLHQIAHQMDEPNIAALVDPENTQQFRTMLIGSGI